MRKVWVAALTGLLALALVTTVDAQTKAKPDKYEGVARCMTCHKTKKSGNQYGIWKESAHAKAYETLASDKAKAIAKEKGIEDPQKSEECLQCHTTGFGVDAKLKGPKLTLEEGVSCEACHGPGSNYRSMKVMKALWAGKVKPESVGLVIPDEKTCVTCHNEKSPTFKPFKFEERMKKIVHPVPKERPKSQ
jgi:uncharacterized paraquat-inducible protein A